MAVRAQPGNEQAKIKPLGAVVRRAHQVLSAILSDAVGDNTLARDPATGVKLPRNTRRRPLYLTHSEVADLADGGRTVHESLVLLLAYTGLRWGDATRLRVRDLDILRKRATVIGERRAGRHDDLRRDDQGA
jgi:integrase